MNTALLIIDPQVDFTVPGVGSLYVEGGDEDMKRLADFVTNHPKGIDRIFVTMDTHWKMAIFHPMFWMDRNGSRPAPFTAITVEDLESGDWQAFHPEMQQTAEEYLRKLRDNKRYYPLVVWPEHCLVGTPGWNVHPDLMQSLLAWEDEEFDKVDYIVKGTNTFTEMYSAIQADVPDQGDPSTLPNMELIDALRQYDRIVVAGEALSHCVANTVRDLVNYGVDPENVVLLTDAMSSVANFEGLGMAFLEDMKEQGMRTSTTIEFQL